LPPSPLSATFIGAPVASIIAGSSGSLQMMLNDTAATAFKGSVTVTMYASTDDTLSGDDTSLATITLPKVNLRPGASKKEILKFVYSTSLSDGAYYVIGSVSAGAGTASVEADGLSAVTIAPPTVDLATSFGGKTTIAVTPGRRGIATIVIQNLGNVTASGSLTMTLDESATATLDGGALVLATVPHAIKIKAGHSVILRVHFLAPTEAAGTYYLVASTKSTTNPLDSNSSNDIASAMTVG